MKSFVLAAALVMTVTGAVFGAEWGAIAYSPETHALGYTSNYSTKPAAESNALAYCDDHASDCRIVVYFHDACGALAVGPHGGWGSNWGNSRASAEAAALANCRPHDNACRIIRWQCSK